MRLLGICVTILSLLNAFPCGVMAEEPDLADKQERIARHTATQSALPMEVWLSFDDLSTLNNPEYEPRFKLIGQSKASQISKEHMRLDEGQMLVRATTLPVFVSATVAGDRIIARVARNTLAFVSIANGTLKVVPLTETCCSALLLYLPAESRRKQNTFAVQSGMIAEVFPSKEEPTSTSLLTGVDVTRDIAGKHTEFVLARTNEREVVKTFGLVPFLKGSNEILSANISQFLKEQ